MKTMKKLASAALALVMALCLAAPAFAAGNDGRITVTNPAPEQVYKLYRILDLSYGEEHDAYTYTVNEAWADFVTGAGAAYLEVDEQGYVTWKEGTDVEAFAKAALLWAEGADAVLDAEGNEVTPAVPGHIETPVAQLTAGTAAEPTEENPDPRAEALVFDGLALGYYLVSSTRGALCALDTTNKAVGVTEKNEKPTIEKDVVTPPQGIGSSVGYEVTVHAKKGAEKYVVHDKMSVGLSFNNDVVVTVGETVVEASNYTVNAAPADDCTFEVVFAQAYLDTLTGNTDIVVKYSATITAEAAKVDSVNNTAKLEYGDISKPEETLPDPVDTPLYLFDIVKTTSNGTKLDGATFTLYDAAAEGNQIPLVKVEDGELGVYYRPATVEERAAEGFESAIIEAGEATVRGLAEGTYFLQEEAAPAGYNKLKTRQEISLTADLEAKAEPAVEQRELNGQTVDVSLWGGVQVFNYTGQELPETGGVGTTIFYIVGGCLAVGAGILLVTKKRMGAEED